MKVSKEYIMALSALIAVLGAVAGGYQFYYRARLDEYQKNIQDEKKLGDVLTALETEFDGCPPEDLIRAVNGEVNPMVQELNSRAASFQVADLRAIQPIPDGKMLSFYYREEFTRLFTEFQQEALTNYPTCGYDRNATFGAPLPDAFTGMVVSKRDIQTELRKITFGLEIMRLLMQSKATYVRDVQLWIPRLTPNKLFSEYTVGFSFAMMPKDLVAFLDKLRVGDVLGQKRYVTVNAISIQNQYLRWPIEPPVEVQMVVTFVQANVGDNVEIEGGEEMAVASAGGGGGIGANPDAQQALAAWKNRMKSGAGGMGSDRGGRRRNVPTTKWGKFVHWLDVYFWPFN